MLTELIKPIDQPDTNPKFGLLLGYCNIISLMNKKGFLIQYVMCVGIGQDRIWRFINVILHVDNIQFLLSQYKDLKFESPRSRLQRTTHTYKAKRIKETINIFAQLQQSHRKIDSDNIMIHEIRTESDDTIFKGTLGNK